MLFNSLSFILFLPAAFLLYYMTPHRYRWLLLFLASCIFYMAFVPSYILILFFIILLDFYTAILIEKSAEKRKKKLLIILSLIANIGFLAFFKYFNFLIGNLTFLFSTFGTENPAVLIDIILPIGLSFHTFQSMGYTLDVYHGKQKAERHLGIYSLYVLFFPQMVAGPIERFSCLGEQLKLKQVFRYENIAQGGRLILFGFFTKMVIADNVSVLVNDIYADPAMHNAYSVINGVFFYSFQIYADFYGYSLIALGSARLFGIQLMDNFKTPYLSRNIPEFWQRWHISLSTWFRDYLFMPLAAGFSKKLKKKSYLFVKTDQWVYIIATMITMLLCGLWHGASWTFVVWGGVHAYFMLYYNITRKIRKKSMQKLGLSAISRLISIWQVLFTFVLISLTWVLFRAENFEKAGSVYSSMLKNFDVPDKVHVDPKIWILLSLFVIFDSLLFNNRYDLWCSKKPFWLRWATYACLLFAILALGGVDNAPFIYFQF